LEAILDALRRTFTLAPDAEISLEANPGTVTPDGLRGLRAMGINRLSLGVQSAQPHELRLLGRIHSFSEAKEAFTWAGRTGFDTINLDLIAGLPGQALTDWQATVEAVLAWEPDHISMYMLSVEEGTPLQRRIAQGELPAPDPDAAADMYEWAGERLAQAGLVQYEISNWAIPGRECQHNLQYWRNEDFLGFGAGAHGAAKGHRYWNVAGVADYIARIGQGERHHFPFSPALEDSEEINRQTAMAETVILGLRLVREGVQASAFAQRFGCSLDEVYGEVIEELSALGLIERTEDGIRLTRRAYLVSNQVFIRFLPEDDES
jgi:oxygen-independent coproporphyrinogen-3 oxidase